MSSFFTINFNFVNLEKKEKPRLHLGFICLTLTLYYFLFFVAKNNILTHVVATAPATLQKF